MYDLSSLLILGALVSLVTGQNCKPEASFPKVTLPWGTVTASSCDNVTNIYTFKDVQFGQDTSQFRFKASVSPPPAENPAELFLDSSTGAACPSIDPKLLVNCEFSGGSHLIVPHDGNSLIFPEPSADQVFSEDCLYLDIYVPVTAFDNLPPLPSLPVIVWFYGGAYVYGSKDFGFFGEDSPVPFYDGTSIIQAAVELNSSAIFVAGNYRLGVLGWLAGNTMQTSASAIPNVGLADQRLLLEFVHDNIAGFGGDASNTIAWGQSAGAGSILHHLIAEGGSRDPMFSKALMQSAAFEWQWDTRPNGTLDKVFNTFITFVGPCANMTGEAAITCLQTNNDAMNSSVIIAAQQAFFSSPNCSGVGPAVDGSIIRELPATALEAGRFFPIDSIISSHVDDEAAIFLPTGKTFQQVLESFVPSEYPNEQASITKTYFDSSDTATSIKLLIRDAIFTCNTRYIYDAMSNKAKIFMLHYGMFESYPKGNFAWHGTDLIPTFWNNETNSTILARRLHDVDGNTSVAEFMFYLSYIQLVHKTYSKYLVQHAITGDPNFPNAPQDWLKAITSGSESYLAQVMDVSNQSFDATYLDKQNPYANCTIFWPGIAKAIQCHTNSSLCDQEKLVTQTGYASGHLEF